MEMPLRHAPRSEAGSRTRTTMLGERGMAAPFWSPVDQFLFEQFGPAFGVEFRDAEKLGALDGPFAAGGVAVVVVARVVVSDAVFDPRIAIRPQAIEQLVEAAVQLGGVADEDVVFQ